MRMRARVLAATLYWLFYLFVFVALRYSDDEGGIPLVILGLPWTILAMAIAYALSLALPAVDHFLVTDAGNFFTAVIISGGMNAILILGVSRVFRWLRGSAQHVLVCVVLVAVVLACAQLVMPMVDRDARERSRPKNVPKSAVYTGGVRGWWQHCIYDPAHRADDCQVWNAGGLILYEDEFVAYDGGSAATSDQLDILGDNSMPQTIRLRNGRILVRKGDEGEMRRFLGSPSGSRPTKN